LYSPTGAYLKATFKFKRPDATFFHSVSSYPFTVIMAPASAMSSPHKPRRKTKKTAHFDVDVKPEAEALVRSPTFPLEALLWPARYALSQWEILPLILMAVGLFRWAAGLWGYSGLYYDFMFASMFLSISWCPLVSNFKFFFPLIMLLLLLQLSMFLAIALTIY
jgi:hypothetical protein